VLVDVLVPLDDFVVFPLDALVYDMGEKFVVLTQ
jgi:hypothetical protein